MSEQNQAGQARQALIIRAPVRGILSPLSETPDDAMASGALGSGVVIEPLSNVFHAPIDGHISSIARTKHAVTLASERGTEILIHVGVDTVSLQGEGFFPQAKPNQTVSVGEKLISIDETLVATRARSLATPIIVLSDDKEDLKMLTPFGLVEQGDPLFEILEDEPPEVVANPSDLEFNELEVRVPLVQGIHARPAAQISELAKSHTGIVEIAHESVRANAKSVSSIMALGIEFGDEIKLRVAGEDAEQIGRELVDLIQAGAGDPVAPFADRDQTEKDDLTIEGPISGVSASSGTAIGKLKIFERTQIAIPLSDGGREESARLLASALRQAAEDTRARAKASSDRQTRSLLDAHASLIEDPELNELAVSEIEDGASAGTAWHAAINKQSEIFRVSGQARLKERIADLKDIEQSVLSILYGETDKNENTSSFKDAIVLADDVTPSEFLLLAEAGAAGFCLSSGGATAHAAILASAHNIPMLVATGFIPPKSIDGQIAILDTAQNCLELDVDKTRIEALRARAAARDALRALADREISAPSRLKSGQDIQVQVNLNAISDLTNAGVKHADGCGLLRSEFLFSDRYQAPSEDEQATAYESVADALEGRDVIIRTLDIGGDKPIAFLDLGPEANPALGLRGIRTSFAHPELMQDQIRAILRASKHQNVRIMAPMVSEVSEIERLKSYVHDQAECLGIDQIPPIGTMIETPSSVVLADQIANVADFVSIGTNDLAQYVMAMDRTNPKLAARLDGLHPAILRQIGVVCTEARNANIDVSVCGGLASDPLAVPLLVGLGVQKLSVIPSMIASTKAIVRSLDLSACEEISSRAIALKQADEVRALVKSQWPDLEAWV